MILTHAEPAFLDTYCPRGCDHPAVMESTRGTHSSVPFTGLPAQRCSPSFRTGFDVSLKPLTRFTGVLAVWLQPSRAATRGSSQTARTPMNGGTDTSSTVLRP